MSEEPLSDGETVIRIMRSREPLGWRLGLERMRRLCSLLGMPQHRFASVHVVGTNGKSSVSRMTTALLEAHGVPAGAYLSPHLRLWRERILIGTEPITEPALAEALQRAQQAAEVADRSAGEEGPVTQFELFTAAAFVALAAARVKVGVIEAGLGGRLDATNVIPSRLTALTSVGLDHTEWLGESLQEIAAEKLAVLRDSSMLVCGELPAKVLAAAERAAERHHAQLVVAPPVAVGPGTALPGYQRANLGVALAAAAALLGDLREDAVAAAIDSAAVPGRAQVLAGEPPAILDAAHNAAGARALAATLPELTGGAKVVCCIAVLEDKDSEAIVEALAPHCARAVCAEVAAEAIAAGGRPGGRSRDAGELAAQFAGQGVEAELAAGPAAGIERGRSLALELAVPLLVTGSHFLIGSALDRLSE